MRVSIVACLVTLFGAPGASAQTRVAPESRPQIQLSYAPIVHRAAPAVVNVYGARVEKGGANNRAMDEFFRRYFGENGLGLQQDRVQRSLGSGVIVDASGLVVTNHHVIEGMTEVKVALADRREFEAEIVLRDPRTDLAVLRLKNGTKFDVIEFGDSEALEVGDLVLAIGNPFGVGQTVTQGIISALARTHVGASDYQFFIQTDAAINPGNSGGVLVDVNGRLIGINSAIFSQSGGSHGIGFAIPSSMVRTVVASARDGSRTVRRPWLGARLQNVSPEIAETMGLERPAGVLVAALVGNGPADEAGLKRGDVILAVDGRAVDDPESFGYRFALKGVTGQTNLSVIQGGKRGILSVKLTSPPETRPRDAVRIQGRSPFAGVTAVNMSPAIAEELQLDASNDGVALSDIDPASVASRVGFQKGDVIIGVNGVQVASSKELERLASRSAQVWEIKINRGGQVLTSVFGG